MAYYIRYGDYDYTRTNSGVVCIGDDLADMLGTCDIAQVKRLWYDLRYSSQWKIADMLILGDDGESKYDYIDTTLGDSGDCIYFSLRGKTPTYTHADYGVVWSPSAQSTRIGRLLKSLLKSSVLAEYGITDSPMLDGDGKKYSVLERLSDYVKLARSPQYLIDVVRGDDIARYYSTSDCESLGSCMQSERESFFDLYAQNPNCSLLIVTLDGVLVGRRLIWDNVCVRGELSPISYADRYYTSRQHTRKLVAQYTSDVLGITHTYDSSHGNMTVSSGVATRHRYYPYMDSFCYLSSDYATLSTSSLAYRLDSTCGMLGSDDDYDDDDDDDGYYCRHCGNYYAYMSSDDDDYCESCYDSLYGECVMCDSRELHDNLSYVSNESIDGDVCESCLDDNKESWSLACVDCDYTTLDGDYLTRVVSSDGTLASVCVHCLATNYRLDSCLELYVPRLQSTMDLVTTQ